MHDSVTFVHAADLHLDAPFQGISSADARVGAELARATFTAFERVVEVALERRVDFVVIAGDAFNSAERSVRAQLRFQAQARRLSDAGIDVFVVHGNHDHLGAWSAGVEWPERVHVFPAGRVERVEVLRDGRVVAAVYGRSFGRRDERENLALGYKREPADPVAIGVLHANVGAHSEYDPYAPCTVEDLRSGGMDYWALGHIHAHEVLSRDPWAVYAGSPQGLDPKETGRHGCVLVEVSPGGAVATEFIETAAVEWAELEVDVSSAQSLDDVAGALASACARVREQAAGNAVCRLRITGRSEAHDLIAAPGALDELVTEVRFAEASTEPWVWVDRVTDDSRSDIDVDAVRQAPDFAGELVRVADALTVNVDGDALVGSLVAPLATTLKGLEPSLPSDEILERARDLALDLLLAEEVRP